MASSSFASFLRARRAEHRAPPWTSLLADPPADLNLVVRITPPLRPAADEVIARHYFPAIMPTTLQALGHTLVAFAQREGCEPFVLGTLRGSHDWGVGGYTPPFVQGSYLHDPSLPPGTRHAALTFLGLVQQQWAPVMQVHTGLPAPEFGNVDHLGLYPVAPAESAQDERFATLALRKGDQVVPQRWEGGGHDGWEIVTCDHLVRGGSQRRGDTDDQVEVCWRIGEERCPGRRTVLGAPCAKKTCEGRGCHEIHAESVRIC